MSLEELINFMNSHPYFGCVIKNNLHTIIKIYYKIVNINLKFGKNHTRFYTGNKKLYYVKSKIYLIEKYNLYSSLINNYLLHPHYDDINAEFILLIENIFPYLRKNINNGR